MNDPEPETDEDNNSEGGEGGADNSGDTGESTSTVTDKVTEVAAPIFSKESLSWVSTNWQAIGIALAVATLFYLMLRWMRKRLKKASEEALEKGAVHKRGLTSLPRRVISQTNAFFLFALALRVAAYFTNAPTGITDFCHILFKIAFIIQLAMWTNSIVLALVDHRISMLEHERAVRLKNARELINFLIKALTYTLATIAILEALDINVTALVAGLGIGTIAVGLAAQNIFSDLFAALSIIVDRPFVIGDKIEFDGMRGYVKKTGLQTTILTTNNGDEMIISNANLIDKTIINWTRASKKRSRLQIDLDSGTPIEKMRELPNVFEKIVTARGLDYVRSGFDSFSSGGLRFKLIYDSRTEDYNEVVAERHEVGLDVIKAFHDQGIELDFEAADLLTLEGPGADHLTRTAAADDSGDMVMRDSDTD